MRDQVAGGVTPRAARKVESQAAGREATDETWMTRCGESSFLGIGDVGVSDGWMRVEVETFSCCRLRVMLTIERLLRDCRKLVARRMALQPHSSVLNLPGTEPIRAPRTEEKS